jgi:signal transduction histidine kinase
LLSSCLYASAGFLITTTLAVLAWGFSGLRLAAVLAVATGLTHLALALLPRAGYRLRTGVFLTTVGLLVAYLVPLAGWASLLEEVESMNDLDVAEATERLELAFDYASALVGQFDLSSEQTDGPRRPIDLGELVRQTLVLTEKKVPPGVEVSYRGQGEVFVGLSDRDVQRVLLNLVQNALLAVAPSGQVRVEVRAVEGGRQNSSSLTTGRGWTQRPGPGSSSPSCPPARPARAPGWASWPWTTPSGSPAASSRWRAPLTSAPPSPSAGP